MGSDKIDAFKIDAFLRSGECVCPFARYCAMDYIKVSATPRFDRTPLLKAVRAFAQTQNAKPDNALVLVTQIDGGYKETKTWAIETFLELMTACVLVSDAAASRDEIERIVQTDIRQIISNDSDQRRPHLALGDTPLMTICMAPVYPTRHPRYAPCALLALTWESDVARAQRSPELVTRIREAMRLQHGFIYDANDLMLPLPKKTQAKEA